MKEGWLCPRCGRINAPFIDHCECKPGTYIQEGNSNISELTNISECIQGNHDWRCIGIETGGTKYRCSRCGERKTEPIVTYKEDE